MNTKLDNITTQYRKFNENQALTEGQLNEFIDYFEDQDRLSRTRLSGVGVGCGFKSTYTDFILQPQALSERASADEPIEIDLHTIAITQGFGVTTDGDLITLCRKNDKEKTTIDFDTNIYKYYRDYNDEVRYKHFRIGDTQIPLLELVTQAEYSQLKNSGRNVDDFKLLSEINNIYNKIVILYLESYSNDETPCQDADCDNNGAEQVSNLKVLLADSESVEDLIMRGDAKDTIYKLHNSYEELFNELPNIEAKRVILDSSIVRASELKSRFQNAIGTVGDLTGGFDAIAKAFNIGVDLGGESVFGKLNSLVYPKTSGLLDDYQYRYDLFKDLIDTYNEIKGLVLHLDVDCCPNIGSFPKHLLLGSVGAKLELGEQTPYRHSFYNSPVTTNHDENYEKIVMLANRFVEKLNGFQSYIGPIKITPSNLYVRLGDKAIPYYYNVDKPLLTKWNFEKTKTDRETYNLSYHTTNLAGENFIQDPLNYNIDDNDFYRIEGHLGLPFETAVQNINDLKVKYGLAFDVIVLLLNDGEKRDDVVVTEPKKVSIEELRNQLLSISNDISKKTGDSKDTLLNLSKLDSQLRLLNKAKFETTSGSSEDVTVVKEDPKKEEITTELLSEFLERKSGLEHISGVEPGATFVLIAESKTKNQVLADFSLPYLCCSKKNPVFLSLPSGKLCQSEKPVLMTIVPLDGQVKAFVNGVQIPAITQTGGQSLFDPSLVGVAYFGQTITFTVNDDPVDTQMVVHEEPNLVVTTGTPVNGENPTNPSATVTFSLSGSNLGNLNYSWNFGDGQSVTINKPTPESNGTVNQSHTYNLVAGQEDTFSPILTVSNDNGCSKQYAIAPIKLKGQSLIQCLSSLEITIQYNESLGPCPGGHRCNSARFSLMANGVLKIGDVNLNNSSETLQAGQSRPNGETRGPNRINTIQISSTDAQAIAATDPNGTGFISFSLVCADASCHDGVAWTTLKLGGVVIYDGCPRNNFLTINPCTGEVKP
ncbi:PKD domain-containing protein [Chryseobacterium formosus]|uniref:PKD domain-containing protein n=1 Tax=Chryseobacterium formosus TaxID=1537363 RepID=A0ABT3XWS5_9FLAO|nr:PKD domain-containing protein [Chryseobacterium formosus]MCX8526128.1 PKD domain-containing protein [Chryseobacterium formosus]